MKRQRHHRPGLEGLEARISPVGFFEGPSPVPVQLFLRGTASGFETVHAAHPGARASVTTTKIKASGVISPLGSSSIVATLHSYGQTEAGSMTIRSPRGLMTLSLSELPGSAGGAFHFRIEGGMTSVPGTNFSSAREQGSGTLAIAMQPGSTSTPVKLGFRSS